MTASEVVAMRNLCLIVDGYNLMHITRFKPLSSDMGELRRCREGLLSLLADLLPEKQYHEIIMVFDSAQAPKRLPDQLRWGHLNVVFARHENTADDLIAKLVQGHAHPRHLVVISSDHRVQNAARRRKAMFFDSDEWFDALLDYEPNMVLEHETDTPPELDNDQMSEFLAAMTGNDEVVSSSDVEGKPSEELENPFPKGYFDDLDELSP